MAGTGCEKEMEAKKEKNNWKSIGSQLLCEKGDDGEEYNVALFTLLFVLIIVNYRWIRAKIWKKYKLCIVGETSAME